MYPPTPQPGTLRQRMVAWIMAHSGTYDQAVDERKRALFGGLCGDVLEIGPGTGPNLVFFPAAIRWTGVEPNPFMRPLLLKALGQSNIPAHQARIETVDPAGARLPANDASIDAVVCTLVLCSVPDPEATLQEVLRILKPGGRFVFIEHVAARRGTSTRTFQNIIQPLWTLVGDGCRPNRETWDTISRAGFASLEIEHFRYSGGGLYAPHISGAAVKG